MTLITRERNDKKITVLALCLFLSQRRKPSNVDTILENKDLINIRGQG
jgi:hypothetical protein